MKTEADVFGPYLARLRMTAFTYSGSPSAPTDDED